MPARPPRSPRSSRGSAQRPRREASGRSCCDARCYRWVAQLVPMSRVSSVSLLITGSIATDHLMSFPGRFADSLVVDQLDKIALSFLVDDLEVRRGGCAANIAFGLGSLGLRPVLVGAVGEDFVDYRAWLERHNVDCERVHYSETRHTARFVCTNDSTMAQIASFYAGAMSRGPRDRAQADRRAASAASTSCHRPRTTPRAMLRHTQECRDRGYRFVADPSQQLAFGDGEMIRDLIEGADDPVLQRVRGRAHRRRRPAGPPTRSSPGRHLGRHAGRRRGPDRARGRGADRRRRRSRSRARWSRPASATPSGPASSPRSSWGLGLERAAQLGCVLAVVRRRAGRHPGVHAPPAGVPRPDRRGVRRGGGGRHRGPRPHAAPLTGGSCNPRSTRHGGTRRAQ